MAAGGLAEGSAGHSTDLGYFYELCCLLLALIIAGGKKSLPGPREDSDKELLQGDGCMGQKCGTYPL